MSKSKSLFDFFVPRIRENVHSQPEIGLSQASDEHNRTSPGQSNIPEPETNSSESHSVPESVENSGPPDSSSLTAQSLELEQDCVGQLQSLSSDESLDLLLR